MSKPLPVKKEEELRQTRLERDMEVFWHDQVDERGVELEDADRIICVRRCKPDEMSYEGGHRQGTIQKAHEVIKVLNSEMGNTPVNPLTVHRAEYMRKCGQSWRRSMTMFRPHHALDDETTLPLGGLLHFLHNHLKTPPYDKVYKEMLDVVWATDEFDPYNSPTYTSVMLGTGFLLHLLTKEAGNFFKIYIFIFLAWLTWQKPYFLLSHFYLVGAAVL